MGCARSDCVRAPACSIGLPRPPRGPALTRPRPAPQSTGSTIGHSRHSLRRFCSAQQLDAQDDVDLPLGGHPAARAHPLCCQVSVPSLTSSSPSGLLAPAAIPSCRLWLCSRAALAVIFWKLWGCFPPSTRSLPCSHASCEDPSESLLFRLFVADFVVRPAAAAAAQSIRYIGCTKGAANVVLAQSVHILDKVTHCSTALLRIFVGGDRHLRSLGCLSPLVVASCV